MDSIKPHQAIKRMRELTEAGVPFSFKFWSLDTTRGTSSGVKNVVSALLRQGLRNDQSDLAQQLISYIDIEQGDVARHFHLPLLMQFNNHIVKP